MTHTIPNVYYHDCALLLSSLLIQTQNSETPLVLHILIHYLSYIYNTIQVYSIHSPRLLRDWLIDEGEIKIKWQHRKSSNLIFLASKRRYQTSLANAEQVCEDKNEEDLKTNQSRKLKKSEKEKQKKVSNAH
jgi:hypothetical protein